MPIATEARKRGEQLSLRATAEERRLIHEAAQAIDVDVTSFLLSNAMLGARRVLADRDQVVLDAATRSAWETLNERPARELPGLVSLMNRPSPFVE